jgi:hypothetical protein
MKKFNDLIIRIINEQLIHGINHLNITLNEIVFSLKNNVIPIFNENIINESTIKYTLDIPESFVNLIKEYNNGPSITKEQILNCVDSNWKFFDKLQSAKLDPIYVGKFNFSDKQSIENFLASLTDQNDKRLIEYSVGLILKLYKNANGLFLPIKNKLILFLLNEQKYNNNTIVHELTHYFQYYFKYGLHKINFKNSFNYSKFEHLNLTKTEIDYLFSAKEYIPHINNFIDSINKFAEIFPEKTEQQWLHEFITYLNKHKYDTDLITCNYFKMWEQCKLDLINLKFVVAILIQDGKVKNDLYKQLWRLF